jgi:hypothetical protein
MREAELAWTRNLVEEIGSGKLGDLDEWAAFYRTIADHDDEIPQSKEAHDAHDEKEE